MNNIEWPAGSLNERRAIFVYEVARQQAFAVNAPIIPEPWSHREVAFQEQFLEVIAKQCGPDRKSSPEELHNDWWLAYEKMGWQWGPERDPVKKTHPDMVPFNELGWEERNKDAVFVALCELARQWILDEEHTPDCGLLGPVPNIGTYHEIPVTVVPGAPNQW
jgi:hypothetical protein